MPLSAHVPDPAALEVLLAVARTGSFNQAAAQVGVSQQAVSARIRSMEAQTGVALVRRGPRGSELTGDGIVVAEWAAHVLDVAARLDAGLGTLRRARRRRLRVSASFTIAEQLLPDWLVSFGSADAGRTSHAADIELAATTSETVIARVRSGQADLGFVEGGSVPSALRTRAVGHDELIAVVAPDHPWARRRTPVRAAELARTPLVAREQGNDDLDAALRAALGPDHKFAEPAATLSTAAAVRAAVLAGAGPAVLSRLAVGDDVLRGRLVRVGVTGVDLRRALRAVWLGERQPPEGAARDLVAHAMSQRDQHPQA